MPSQSELTHLTPEERREYGFLRVRDAAFDAVSKLWKRRQDEGISQAQLANEIGGDPGWVSKNLRGPGNWTMKTFGAFVEALNGDVDITIRGMEDPLPARPNFHAYVEYELPATTHSTAEIGTPIKVQGALSGNPSLQGRSPKAVILIP
jgi:hypothetical protein